MSKRGGNQKPCLVGERILEAVAEDEAEGQALALLVRAGAGLGGEDAAQLVQHPVLGGIQPLQVLLGSTRHFRRRRRGGGGGGGGVYGMDGA